MKKPKRRFRCRRSGSALYIQERPTAPMPPGVEAWIEQNRHRLERLGRPGEVCNIQVWHDPDCLYPEGDHPCTCVDGPEIRLAGEDPEAN